MNKTRAISYLHSSNNKRTEPFDSWEPAMVTTSLRGIYSGTVQGHASESHECVVQPTLKFEPDTAGSLESTQKSPDACVPERLRR